MLVWARYCALGALNQVAADTVFVHVLLISLFGLPPKNGHHKLMMLSLPGRDRARK